jgi:anaerobic selenocysteine-containing dehydrogenase
MTSTSPVYRVCTLCEATCGIEVHVENGVVTDIRGDAADPFSRGYICPKATGMKGLEEDPDRLRQPVRRGENGFEPISWDEAFELALAGLARVRDEGGPGAVGAYVGNPSVHSYHNLFYGTLLLRALGTQQLYSASTADQRPKEVSCGLMFGGGGIIPVPDLDHTRYLMILGGNPLVSNGSLMTAPGMRNRLRAIRERGGTVVVIDPRRSETALAADEHHFIRPGTDALFLLALCHVIVAEGLTDLGDVAEHVGRLDEVEELVARFAPERVAERCGIAPETIRRLARELCAAESAACYGRIGTTCQEFGTVASWAVDLVNALSGNLDRRGGVMFPEPAAMRGANRREGRSGGRGVKFGRRHSRVKGHPERFGEFPVATLADEIEEPGEGQLRAMLTVAGNPVSSAPNAARLARAFESLEFMVSIDYYVNETTRYADVILPPPPPLQRDHYDLAFYGLSVRNIAKFSRPATERPEGHPHEWEILLTLAKGLMGTGEMSLEEADDFAFKQFAEGEIGDGGRWEGLDFDEVAAAEGARRGPARMLDVLLRTGAYGDGFGREPSGLSLEKLEANPHGIDLGPLMPRIPEVLRTVDARVDLAPEALVDDVARLERSLDAPVPAHVLIGRRHLRSNNSWMHNVHSLVKGRNRCTLLIHPDDAAKLGVGNGENLHVVSRIGAVDAPVELSDEIMPGVVSLPHGWGHDLEGVELSLARANGGVNVNWLSDDAALDEASGNAAFNGVPVTLSRPA